jgi:DNA-binding response OmpR family regulator
MPTILIVEDEARMRRLLELDLAHAGFQTLSAPDAEAALDLLRRERLDLVLTDLKLPGMSGLDLATMSSSPFPWKKSGWS